MEFTQFNKLLQDNFKRKSKNVEHLFEVDLDKDELWDLYLDSFPAGTNEIFRERREYDCSCCRQFVRNFGNVVILENNQMSTIWDFNAENDKYQAVINELAAFVKSHKVKDVYINKERTIGTASNKEVLDTGDTIVWSHFNLRLDSRFVSQSHKSEEELKGDIRETKNVYSRGLNELTKDSLDTVIELIRQNSLYKGEEWLSLLVTFADHMDKYSKVQDSQKENYVWETVVSSPSALTRLRNTSIGTLLVNISDGMDLETAVSKYESIVAPENYKRPKAIFTKKMLDDAKKKIDELGYNDSLERRHATLEDISINDILFSNRDSIKKLKGFDIFDEMSKSVVNKPKQFSRVEEMSIDRFIGEVLPNATELEAYVENQHMSNFVSLIAPVNEDSKSMFKWDNPFSWGYTGNITDSSMRENVKSAGGNVDGVLRFSIQWNDEDYNPNDFDAHVEEPSGNMIYWGNDMNYDTSGNLDVDIISPTRGKPAVENITWLQKHRMEKGLYRLFVRNFQHSGGTSGFKAEVEFNGEIHKFDYNQELRHKEDVQVAEVYFDGEKFTIKELLPSNVSNREIWGLTTNQFVPVSLVLNSPNHWNNEKGVGNKHYMFMLKDCINPETPSGIFNEFLDTKLTPHRKVFEAMGSKMRVEPTDNQLSGLGFASTQRNELVVKVTTGIERMLKLKF